MHSSCPASGIHAFLSVLQQAQTWMAPLAWLALMLAGLPIMFFLPAHWLFVRLAPPAAQKLPKDVTSGHLVLASERRIAGLKGPGD